ncbi:MAG: tcdA [Burkholderiaceae bacterium]|nr:tcdA [Burkholderiaceae bacterium]
MSTNTERRFAGLNRLYGEQSIDTLARAHVCVVGVGGVGSWAVEALARCGVGTLTLIDADHVVESNVNRQVQALTDTLGKAKTTALRERIAQINPSCMVHEVDDFIGEDTLELIPQTADVVLDCTDQVRAKLAMIVFCKHRGQKLLTCGAAGGKIDATRIVQTDIAFAVQDPILAKIRQKLRHAHKLSTSQLSKATKIQKMNVPVLFSDEAMLYPKMNVDVCVTDNTAPQGLNCAGFGSSVMVTASFGMMAAQWAIARMLE